MDSPEFVGYYSPGPLKATAASELKERTLSGQLAWDLRVSEVDVPQLIWLVGHRFHPRSVLLILQADESKSVLRKRCGQSLIIHAKGQIIISKNRSST